MCAPIQMDIAGRDRTLLLNSNSEPSTLDSYGNQSLGLGPRYENIDRSIIVLARKRFIALDLVVDAPETT